jgi:hypothetical protein
VPKPCPPKFHPYPPVKPPCPPVHHYPPPSPPCHDKPVLPHQPGKPCH